MFLTSALFVISETCWNISCGCLSGKDILFRRTIFLSGVRRTARMRLTGERRAWAVTGIFLPDCVKVQVRVHGRHGFAWKVRDSHTTAGCIPGAEALDGAFFDTCAICSPVIFCSHFIHVDLWGE